MFVYYADTIYADPDEVEEFYSPECEDDYSDGVP